MSGSDEKLPPTAAEFRLLTSRVATLEKQVEKLTEWIAQASASRIAVSDAVKLLEAAKGGK